MKTAEQMFADWASPARFMALLMGVLAGVALALAAIGTDGVIAYGASQRTRELAVRVALGATSGDITRLVAGASLRLGMMALAIGIPGAWATTRALKGLLFGTSPADPLVFTIATLILLCVSVLAGWLPARKASRVDPARALRT